MDKNNTSATGWSFAERLNLLIAVCAVLISAASFYATYLQADAAEKQVRATTWPMLEFKHGNAKPENYESWIQFLLVNSGVGPAHIQYFRLHWNDKTYADVNSVIADCCSENVIRHIERIREYEQREHAETNKILTGSITSKVENSILSPGSTLNVYEFPKNEVTAELWEEVNLLRWKISATVCYCSVLGDCYLSDFDKPARQVAQCPISKVNQKSE